MGLLDDVLDPQTLAAVKQLGQPSPDQLDQARQSALISTGLSMLANNGNGLNRRQSLGMALGAGGQAGMGAYQNTLEDAQKNQQQNISMAMALSKLKKEQEQQARLNALSDKVGAALTPQTQDQTVGYRFNTALDSNNVQFNPGDDENMAKWAIAQKSKIATGYKPTPDEVVLLNQIESRIQPVKQQVQTQPDLENMLRSLGVQYGIQDPERGKLLLQAADQYKPQTVNAGSFQRNPVNGQMQYVGDPTKGVTIGANGQVQTMPGAMATLAALTGAQERSKNEAQAYDPVKRITTFNETGIDPVDMSVAPGLPKKLSDAVEQARQMPAPLEQGYNRAGNGVVPTPGGSVAQNKENAAAAFDKTIQSANEILNHPGLNASVGLRGVIPAIPGTESANFGAKLDTLKSQTFLPMVQALKGMGSLSNAEGEKLTAAVGALDTKMSAPAFKRSVEAIIKDLQSARDRSLGQGVATDLQSAAMAELQRRGK